MKNLTSYIGKNLEWKGRTLNFKPEEIFCGNELVARIRWYGPNLVFSKRRFLAEGKIKEGKWTFYRKGFLLDRKIIAEKSRKRVAICNYTMGSDLKIEMTNGRIFRVRQQGILHPKYFLEAPGGKKIFTVEINLLKALALKKAVKINVGKNASLVKESPFLFLFFIYFLSILTWDTRFI